MITSSTRSKLSSSSVTNAVRGRNLVLVRAEIRGRQWEYGLLKQDQTNVLDECQR